MRYFLYIETGCAFDAESEEDAREQGSLGPNEELDPYGFGEKVQTDEQKAKGEPPVKFGKMGSRGDGTYEMEVNGVMTSFSMDDPKGPIGLIKQHIKDSNWDTLSIEEKRKLASEWGFEYEMIEGMNNQFGANANQNTDAMNAGAVPVDNKEWGFDMNYKAPTFNADNYNVPSFPKFRGNKYFN